MDEDCPILERLSATGIELFCEEFTANETRKTVTTIIAAILMNFIQRQVSLKLVYNLN